MSAYQRILTLQDDFRLESLSFRAATNGMKEITEAIRQRQAADKAADEARRAELAETANDQSRPASVRRLAEVELAAMPDYAPTITEAERAAFAAERSEAALALAELHQTVAALQEAFTEAKAELDKIRAETIKKAYFDTWQNWLTVAEADYQRLEG